MLYETLGDPAEWVAGCEDAETEAVLRAMLAEMDPFLIVLLLNLP